MKGIALPLIALALLLSACVNPVPTPETDADPLVELTADPANVAVNGLVTVTANVTDDTPGPPSYTWRLGDWYRSVTGSASHTNTEGFTLDITEPTLGDGITSGHSATYTFGSEPYSLGDTPLLVDLDSSNDRAILIRGGNETSLTRGETITLADDRSSRTAAITYDGPRAGAKTPIGARFTIDDREETLLFGEMQSFTFSGYTVDVTAIDYEIDATGKVVKVVVEATYPYLFGTRREELVFTPTTGARITLPDGTSVDVYFERGLYEIDVTSVALTIGGETKTVSLRTPETIGGTSVYVLEAWVNEHPDVSDSAVRLLAYGRIADVRATGMTLTEPYGTIRERNARVASLTDQTLIIESDEYRSDWSADPLFKAYSWVHDNGTLYYADMTRFLEVVSSRTRFSFQPSEPTLYEVSYTATDERGNSGSDTITVAVS